MAQVPGARRGPIGSRMDGIQLGHNADTARQAPAPGPLGLGLRAEFGAEKRKTLSEELVIKYLDAAGYSGGWMGGIWGEQRG